MNLNSNSPLLTAIVPVYYKENDLSRLAKWMGEISLFHLPIEVILIQDGDPNSRHPWLEELAKLPNRFPVRLKIVDKRSAGGARNAGLEAATGEWIIFWDCDDEARPREIVELLKITEPRANVVISEFEIEDYALGSRSKPSYTGDLLDLCETLGWWRIAFRRSRIAELRIPELSMGEDQIFVARLNLNDQEIIYSHKIVYTYVTNRSGQVTGNHTHYADLACSIVKLGEVLEGGDDLHPYILGLFLRQAMTGIKRIKGKDRGTTLLLFVRILIKQRYFFRRDFYRIVARIMSKYLKRAR